MCVSRSVMSGFCNPMDCSPPAPLSMEFSGQEYWTGLPFPSLGNLPDLGIEPRSPELQADSLPSEPPENPFLIEHLLNTRKCSNCFITIIYVINLQVRK